MKLCDKIRILRKARGMSQAELGFAMAKDEGISRQSVSSWENGTSEPKLENIVELAKVLNVSYDALLDEAIDLDNQSVLQAVLNNDYDKNENYDNTLSYNVYRSLKPVLILFAFIIVGLLITVIVTGCMGYNEVKYSEMPELKESTNIMGGITNLNEYVKALALGITELQNTTLGLYRYTIYISVMLIVVFVSASIIMFITSGRKIATLTQHNLIIKSLRFKYIGFDKITSINKKLLGVEIVTEKEKYNLLFIAHKDELIRIYNEIKLIK